MAERVIVAKIGAAHGVRGEVRLWTFTQDPMAITAYGPLETEDGRRSFEIESVRAGKDHLVARLKGVADRDAAAALTNVELYVPRERLPPAEEDEYYYSDLVGLDAVNEQGLQIGVVHAIHNFGAGDLIEITPFGSGGTVMLPFTETTVPKIDLAAKQIVIVPPAEVEAKEDE
jgi:16S rRNA processing protein RimM